MIAVVKDLSPPVEDLVDGLGDANGESLQCPSQCPFIQCLSEQVDVVVHDGVVDQSKAKASLSLGQGLSDSGHELGASQGGQSLTEAPGDVDGKARREGGSLLVGQLGPRLGRSSRSLSFGKGARGAFSRCAGLGEQRLLRLVFARAAPTLL